MDDVMWKYNFILVQVKKSHSIKICIWDVFSKAWIWGERVGDKSNWSVSKLPHNYSVAFGKTYHYSILVQLHSLRMKLSIWTLTAGTSHKTSNLNFNRRKKYLIFLLCKINEYIYTNFWQNITEEVIITSNRYRRDKWSMRKESIHRKINMSRITQVIFFWWNMFKNGLLCVCT